MKFKGIVFDFNGTLFWDTHLHNQAWDVFLKKYDINLNNEEKLCILHGKNNELIIEELFGNRVSAVEADHLISEKELIYQKICKKEGLVLAPGAIDFLDFLSEEKIPFTIATASGKENVIFYFEFLNLYKWFDRKKIVFNDGTIKSKPDPEIFLKAIEKINLRPSETIIFEDSIAGIKSAESACAGKIIIVNSTDYDYSSFFDYQVIDDFSKINRKDFFYT